MERGQILSFLPTLFGFPFPRRINFYSSKEGLGTTIGHEGFDGQFAWYKSCGDDDQFMSS